MYGSKLFWQLTVRFRGLIRPSSPACPKASTSCPESRIIFLSFLTLRLFADLWDVLLQLHLQIVLMFLILLFIVV